MPYDILYDSLSNKGERNINEDYLGIAHYNEGYSFILCDGLGGHGNGDVASKLVVNEMKSRLESGMSMEDSIMNAQEELLKMQTLKNEQNSMRTTLTCLYVSEKTAKMGHVGDSRIYCFERGKYKFRTNDHSIPQMLFERGEIKEKEIRHHEDRSRLMRVMGNVWDSPKYEIKNDIKISKNTSFLLCSDGFWELIDEKMMGKALKKAQSPKEWLTSMENIVLENGRGTNMDNYS